MHIWEGLSVRALCIEQWPCVTDKVITMYIEQAYVVTTIHAIRVEIVCDNAAMKRCPAQYRKKKSSVRKRKLE